LSQNAKEIKRKSENRKKRKVENKSKIEKRTLGAILAQV
jgi:hypothetical protein